MSDSRLSSLRCTTTSRYCRNGGRATTAMVGLLMLLSAAGATSTSAQPPLAQCVPVIDHVEYTQAVQKGNNPGDPQYEIHSSDPYPTPVVPLVGWKTLTARFYVRLSESCSQQGITQLTNIDIRNSGWVTPWGRPGAIGKSDNGPITVTQGHLDPQWDRHDPDSTLNVTRMLLPWDGEFHFIAELVQADDPFDPPLYWTQYGIPVSAMHTPSIVGVPVMYNGVGLPDDQKRDVSEGVVDPPHWAVWPLPDYRWGGGYRFFPDNYQEYVGTRIETLQRNLYRKLCRWDEAGVDPDAIIGWVNHTERSKGEGSDDLHVAFAPTHASQLNLAHEVGHLYFGEGHVQQHGLDDVGWDVNNIVPIPNHPPRVKPLSLDSLMMPVGGPPFRQYWINRHPHYMTVASNEDAYNKALRCPNQLRGESLPPIEYFHITGYVPLDPQDPGYLDPTYLEMDQLAIVPEVTGNGSLELRDATGFLLYSTAFTVDGDNRHVSEVVPAPPDMYEIQLRVDGQMEDSLVRSPNPPQVAIDSPEVGEVVTPTLSVAWTASDPDGDELHSIVEYSADGGTTWLPIGVNHTGAELDMPASGLACSGNAVVRVSVSDGINTAVSTVGSLTVPGNHSPVVAVIAPNHGDHFKQGAEVVFVGTAYDREDGSIPDEDVSWTVVGNGRMVTGSGWYFSLLSGQPAGPYGPDLPPGDYLATMEAVDSQGAFDSTHVAITIIPR